MAYNVKNQDDFNKLNPQDKISYLGQNPNSNIYKNELNRVNGILGQNPNNNGALDWYSRVQAANSGVDANAINNNTYDPSKFKFQNPANGAGIRDTMVGMGMDNNKIGWRGDPGGLGTVTYDGKDFMQANSLNNGTSYAANANDIYGAAANYWKGTPEQVVDVTDYLSGKQLPFNVGYQNGKVMINGIATNPLYEIDGNAYMNQSQLDQIVNQAMQQSGIQNNADIWKKYDDKYTPMIDSMLDKIVNRKDFNYDPEQDAAFRSYRDQYNREGDKALRNTMGSMAGLTGGFINSAAVTAGAQAEQQWADRLMDRVPELQQNAWGRYVDNFNMDRSALGDVQNQYSQAFNREYGVNRDTMDDIRYNNALNVARDDKNYDRRWNEKVYNTEEDWRNKQWERDGDWHQQDEVFRWTDLNNQNNLAWSEFNRGNIPYDQMRVDNALTNAQRRGYFTQEEAALLNVPANADPWNYDKTALQIQNDAQLKLLSGQYALQSKYGKSGGSGRSGRSSSSKKVINDEKIDEGGSGISAQAQQLYDYTDAYLRQNEGVDINSVTSIKQAETILAMGAKYGYTPEIVNELLESAGLNDDVLLKQAADNVSRRN